MKKTVCVLLAFILVACFAACGKKTSNTSDAVINYGESQKYTHKDIDAAADVVKKQLNDFECTVELHYLTYAGDDVSTENLDYCIDIYSNEEDFVECLVFESEFKVLDEGDGSLVKGDTHTYTWYLARTNGGKWQLVSYGYG